MITVIKNDHTGQEVWQYPAQVLERGAGYIVVEARFNAGTVEAGPLTLTEGDRMVEWFYTGRWYNIFEVHDGETDALKGWYCNITRPAHITDEVVAADDLALDVIVMPGGAVTLDDEDDYAALPLTPAEREATQAALRELLARIRSGRAPF
jgi:hypothetical protein